MARAARIGRFGWPIAAACCLAVCFASPLSAADDLYQQRRQLFDQYQAKLQALAQEAASAGHTDFAGEVQAWFRPIHPRLLFFAPAPSVAPQKPAEATAPTATAPPQWQARLDELRREQADALFAMAQLAARQRQLSLAMVLLNDTLRENPDHADARRLVGDVNVDGRWCSPYQAEQLRKGLHWHDKFGWLPPGHVERYEAGERFYNGQWISQERDAELHADIRTPWKIETDHFSITTNHSLEGGVALGEKLERLHRVWRQLFAAYYGTASQWNSAFAGGAVPDTGRRKHSVMFLKDRTEFQRVLQNELPPQVQISGIYLSGPKISYFYADETRGDTTLNHEATHQLFHESRRVTATIGQRANAWIIEGIACFMESLADRGDALTVGGIDAYRIQDHRFYLHRNQFYMPMGELVALGVNALQRQNNLGMIYAQSAAVTDYLMFAGDGRYRDGLVDYLLQLYVGRDRPNSLTATLGLKPDAIDEAFRQFAEVTDEDLAQMPPSDTGYLVFGGSQITDAGLANLSRCRQLRWLDLAGTQVTDEGMAALAKIPSLVKLDLSGTRITDAGLAHLATLPNLQSLNVEQTNVSDRAVQILRNTKLGIDVKN